MFLSEEMCETTAMLFKETQNKDLPYCQRVWISVAVFFLFFFMPSPDGQYEVLEDYKI